MAWIGYLNIQAGAKISSYVEPYEYVKLYYGNAREFLIDFIIFSHFNVTYERLDVSRVFD